MKSLYLTLSILSTLLLTGCITEFKADLSFNDTQVLMVTGNIIENTDAIFYVSKSFPLEYDNIYDGIPKESFVNNAKLTIIGSNGYTSSPAINLGKGAYRISVGILEDDVEYGIRIEYDNDIYQSMPAKPLYTPEVDSVTWEQPKNYGPVYFYVSTSDDMNGAKFFIWNCTEDWEISVVYPTTILYDPTERKFYATIKAPFQYCWKKNEPTGFVFGSTESLSENKIINKQFYQYNDPSDDRFSALYSITVNQRAISKGAYEYYQNIMKMNQDMGGLFTPQPAEYVGNITCITDQEKKVLGYIDVSKNTTQKTIFIYSDQIVRAWPPHYCDLFSNEGIQGLLIDKLYESGFRPAGEPDTTTYVNEVVPYEWAPAHCTDCTVNGGTKDRPDFWPNDHR